MKKIILVLLLTATVLLAVSCGKSAEETEILTVNKMTAAERERVNKHGLTLLDAPLITDPVAEFKSRKHSVQIELTTQTKAKIIENAEASRSLITEEEYRDMLDYAASLPEDYSAALVASYFVDGLYLFDATPFTYGYEGGRIQFFQNGYDKDGQLVEQNVDCANPEEYYVWLKENLMLEGKTEAAADIAVCKVRLAYEAYLNGTYETVPEGSIDLSDPSTMDNGNIDEYCDYRDRWEYERDSVEAIKDNIEEISIYDEEMGIEFLVHVVLPPNYDSGRAYPVLLLTDGVYRFGNTPQLRKLMEDGKAEDTLLVTLGYGYHTDGTDEANRMAHLVTERAALLDFITDNLMPYLGENYKIDYSRSTLYGHSDGGVFAHYALFTSDLYENQPFGNYIIGSPAFWGLYQDPEHLDVQGYVTNYGYFNRNVSLNKSVFLCGGSLEDPDYADLYNGHKSTLEGLEALKTKLENYGADVIYKLYESHHYQYIPEMLEEYLTASVK